MQCSPPLCLVLIFFGTAGAGFLYLGNRCIDFVYMNAPKRWLWQSQCLTGLRITEEFMITIDDTVDVRVEGHGSRGASVRHLRLYEPRQYVNSKSLGLPPRPTPKANTPAQQGYLTTPIHEVKPWTNSLSVESRTSAVNETDKTAPVDGLRQVDYIPSRIHYLRTDSVEPVEPRFSSESSLVIDEDQRGFYHDPRCGTFRGCNACVRPCQRKIPVCSHSGSYQ